MAESLPFEALWAGLCSQLSAVDMAVASAASRMLRAAALAAARETLENVLGHVEKPCAMSWPEALFRAWEWPRLLVVGGEDSADMPQLQLAMVTLQGNGPRHKVLPIAGAEGCSLPTGRYRLSAAQVGQMVYVTGGTGPDGDPCREVLRFNTVTHQWDTSMRMDPMPTPRYGHEAVSLFNRYLLCIGGKAAGGNDGVSGGSTDVLDTETGRWFPLPCRLECPRVYFGAVSFGSTVIVSGGMSLGVFQGHGNRTEGLSEGRLSSTEVLDVSKLPNLEAPELRWRRGPWLQFPRYDFSLAAIGGSCYAIGGAGARQLVEVLSVTEFTKNAPQHRPPGLQPALLSRGWVDIHVMAGQDGVESSSAVSESGQWVLHPVELPEVRSCINAVAVDNQLVLIGGSARKVLSYRAGDPAWLPLGVDLSTMRLGAKAVAFGRTAN